MIITMTLMFKEKDYDNENDVAIMVDQNQLKPDKTSPKWKKMPLFQPILMRFPTCS